MEALPKRYTRGTHRLRPPEETLARIRPHLASFGITRCADVTGLDRVGIPVYCAIRPSSRSVQVHSGKGLRAVDAKVSACMEAIEVFHAEQPPRPLRRGSLKSMRRGRRRVIAPDVLPDFRTDVFFSSDFVIDWVPGEDLLSGEEVWLPASAAYIREPLLYDWSSNGLASGNHLVEATLHGLYEVIERDAVSRLSRRGQVTFSPGRCRFIRLDTVIDESVRELQARLSNQGIHLVLIWIKSGIPVHTFMAVLLDRNPFSHSSTVNIGYGTHRSASVAATRAITEGAQSRAAYIHGSREDLTRDSYEAPHDALFAFFDRIDATADWDALRSESSDDLRQDYEWILKSLAASGRRDVFRVDMTRPPLQIPVTKVWVCGLERNPNLF
jgi:ribosomal protein S12 methylthiotransferase accessory factor